MHEKKRKLIESGLKLFSAKGYHQTSIQEIASAAGVSKGSFYIYFDSKEQFIATAIQHFYMQMNDRMKQIREATVDPRESFERQINAMIEYIFTYKDFIMMHFRENISLGEQADKLMEHVKISSFQSLRENVLHIYGEKINDIAVDVVIQIDGLINAYSKWIVIDEIQMEREKVGPFLVRRLDDIVNGMLMQKESPLTFIPDKFKYILDNGESPDESLKIISTMKEKVLAMDSPGTENAKRLMDTVNLLEEELSKEIQQPIIIQGLLAHFRDIPELKLECEQLAKTLKINLLN
ncbi:TetR/AcrR family transcriptional regulator [Oceanobacillus damuensis]|uniref:TetR/AcrR family transcriptional regulator n=1 Tax=Oceanobacillus damuensis TaxID=937928 RepID=UPI00082EFA40|nr:TetR/AcrR family transcriptional regulator [Oceanobacillus damuensis]